jgi:hypothetical protein
MERAAVFALAALSLDPENPSALRCRDQALKGLLKRAKIAPGAAATLDSTLALALAVAMGATGQRTALMDLLESLGDFASVVTLCEEIEGEAALSIDARADSARRRFRALRRQAGMALEAADLAATEDLRQWLSSLGPAEALETATLRHRVMVCFGHEGYRQNLCDLRELKRRQPDDLWIAYNLCVILRHARHPDLAGSVDLIATEAMDGLASLRTRFDLARSMGAMPELMAISARLAESRPAFGVVPDLYAMALDHDAQPSARFGRPRAARTLLYATLVCWGDAYIELMEQVCLASLLAPGNFPTLAQQADIVLELYTAIEDLPLLRASAKLRLLAEFCEVRIHCLPPSTTSRAKTLSYLILGFATHATVLRAAAQGADLLFLYADVTYARDCFSTVAARLTTGRRALFTDPLNLYATPMLERMASHRHGDALIMSSAEMIEAASHSLSKRLRDTIDRPGVQRATEQVCRVIFATESGLRAHGFVIAPVYVSHAALAPIRHTDFATQDGRIVEHFLNHLEEDEIEVLPGEAFCSAELCDGDASAFALVDLGLAQAVERYFTGHGMNHRRLRLFRRPIEFPGLIAPGEPLMSEEEVAARLADIQRLFETSPHLVDLAEEQEVVRAHLYGR